jgi:dolichol kinase
MSQALALSSRDLATELRAVLHDLDPVRWRGHLESSTREAIDALRDRLSVLMEMAEKLKEHPHVEPLHAHLVALAHVFDQLTPEPSERTAALRQRWGEFRLAALPHYEHLVNSLDAFDIHVPSLRPTNHLRSVWHAMNGVMVLLAIQWVLQSRSDMIAISLSFASFAWSLEISRRYSERINRFLMRCFRLIAHPHEAWRVNSATWYGTAMLCLALLGDARIASVAVIVLGVADPAAALVGRRWGRIRLLNGRTLEGSLAFIVSGSVVAGATLSIFYPAIPTHSVLVVSLVASVVGAAVELVCRRIDDNLAIPVGIGLVLVYLFPLIGV